MWGQAEEVMLEVCYAGCKDGEPVSCRELG